MGSSAPDRKDCAQVATGESAMTRSVQIGTHKGIGLRSKSAVTSVVRHPEHDTPSTHQARIKGERPSSDSV